MERLAVGTTNEREGKRLRGHVKCDDGNESNYRTEAVSFEGQWYLRSTHPDEYLPERNPRVGRAI